MSSSEPVSAAAPGGIDHHDRSGNGDGDGDGDKGSVEVTALEQEVLGEYERLVGNMDRLSQTLTDLSTSTTTSTTITRHPATANPIPNTTGSGTVQTELTDSLRDLERKVASVYTLMKASVYSIVLQQGDQVDQLEGNNDHDHDHHAHRHQMGDDGSGFDIEVGDGAG